MGDETKKELFDNENVSIKQDSEDETHFTISVWDLGGQDEFISTHHLFLDTEATTGRARLIRTRLIRSSILFEVSMKCFPIIFLSFHVKNALLIRSST